MAAIAGIRFAAIIWRLELPVLSLEEEATMERNIAELRKHD